MGKKYLDTKEGSLEQSILGVWWEEAAANTQEGELPPALQKAIDKKKNKKDEDWKKKGPKAYDKKEDVKEASGDKEAYQKFFNKALKKFKVKSPADFKSDEEKKKFYDYIDKGWEGDNEKAETVREFKVQNMRDALIKVWDIDEGELPPALKKAIDAKKKDKEEGKEYEENPVNKNGKTMTGKKPAKVDTKPGMK